MTCILQYQGARDGAVMTALFCLCGPGSNPRINAICGLSLLLILSFVLRGFCLSTPQRSTFPNSNLTRDQVDYRDVLPLNHYLFISCT